MAVRCSVVTLVLNLVPKIALLAKNAAVIPAVTASARKNAASPVSLATRDAPGNASIRDVPNCAGSHAIVSGVTSRVQSFFLVSMAALVCVGKYARKSVESATRTKSRKFSSEPKTTRRQGSWN